MRLKSFFLLAAFIITAAGAENISSSVIPTKHNKKLTIGEIAEIQPGLGSIMREFSYRFYVTYYAAKAKNWDLANYQLKELLEAQEIAEVTRPEYTQQLKKFENSSIKKVQQSIKSKNWKQFKQNYTAAVNACNACHKANGYPYIKYRLPKKAPRYLRMNLEN